MAKHTIQVEFTQESYAAADLLVIGLFEGGELSGEAERVDEKTSGVIARVIREKKFTGKFKQTCIIGYAQGMAAKIMLMGLGKSAELSRLRCQQWGGALYTQLAQQKAASSALLLPEDEKRETILDCVAAGAELASYCFEDYKTIEDEDEKPVRPETLALRAEPAAKHEVYKRLAAVRQGVFLARDVVTTPPNLLTPEIYGEQIKHVLSASGVKVRVLARKHLEKLGMGALIGVAQGSENDPCVVVMEWNGAPASKDTKMALVGKGVTFDTGGISLKPANGMEDMKYDMAGSAAVIGTMLALALRKAPVNAVGIVGLVENMPGGNAQRPSDVVTTLSGQTVEVLNTDAEGRLVLADILTYVQDEYEPKAIVDLATLTGAIVVALGSEYAGLFSNSDELSRQLTAAGDDTGEKLWRFPLTKEYDKLINSPIADMQNISTEKGAGSITAAQFLQRFIKQGVQWAHLDIAGTAWARKPGALNPKGATGFGVRLLDHMIAQHYEQ